MISLKAEWYFSAPGDDEPNGRPVALDRLMKFYCSIRKKARHRILGFYSRQPASDEGRFS
jgi:hypothetical protein